MWFELSASRMWGDQWSRSLHDLGILFLNGPNPASFCLVLFFSRNKYITNFTINEKSVDGVLGTQTRGGKMVGADESTGLWRHPWSRYSNCPSWIPLWYINTSIVSLLSSSVYMLGETYTTNEQWVPVLKFLFICPSVLTYSVFVLRWDKNNFECP